MTGMAGIVALSNPAERFILEPGGYARRQESELELARQAQQEL